MARLGIFFCGLVVALICSEARTADLTKKLSSGHEMPMIGLGTWQLKSEDVDKAVTAALENGYRHIDTAFVYDNEEAIGKTLKKWFNKGNKREDLFVTTKLPPVANRAADVESYLKLSLEKLGLQYVDMYLIHTPTGYVKRKDSYEPMLNEDGSFVLDFDTDHTTLWKAMEDQVKAGRTKSIGISNFNETQVLNVYKNAEIKPSNLQVEWQIYNQQKQLLDTCRKNDITVTSYSTLGSPGKGQASKTESSQALPQHLENPTVQKIAKKHNKATAQVLLRYAIQSGIIVIPKSLNPERIKSNHEVFDFELSKDEMKELSDLDKGEDGRIYNFLHFKGLEKHPQYPWPAQLKNLKN